MSKAAPANAEALALPLAFETSGCRVGLQTVRTLLGKIDGTDRTSQRLSKYRKIDIDRQWLNRHKARKRTRDALPKRMHEKVEKATALLKESKR